MIEHPLTNASAEKEVFQPILSRKGRAPLRLDTMSTTEAKREVVMDKAQPDEIANAANVGSTGSTGNAPKILPKKTLGLAQS